MVAQLAHTVVDVENSSIYMCPFFPASLKEKGNKIHIHVNILQCLNSLVSSHYPHILVDKITTHSLIQQLLVHV